MGGAEVEGAFREELAALVGGESGDDAVWFVAVVAEAVGLDGAGLADERCFGLVVGVGGVPEFGLAPGRVQAPAAAQSVQRSSRGGSSWLVMRRVPSAGRGAVWW